MATFNLSSASVTMFPSTKRGASQPSAREMTEEAMTRVYRENSSKESYIISVGGDSDMDYIIDWSHANDPLEFMLHGYNFVLEDTSDFLDSALQQAPNAVSLWGHISINQIGYKQIQGQDDHGLYLGLKIETDLDDPEQGQLIGNYRHYFIKLLEKHTDGEWYVPLGSYKRIDEDKLEFEIDGGYWNPDGTGDLDDEFYDLNHKPIK